MELSPVNMSWTNEKHVKFLNSMEESFVRAMLEKKKNNKDHRHPPRLDRYLPDTSDSTLDLKTSSRITKNRNSLQGGRMGGRCEKRSRTVSSQPSNASQDQVVPQIEIRTAGDKDEMEQQNVNVPDQLALAAPIN
ncbi:unnamed protein product [Malus baccata var. baccata]|uniref:uncharacterized protein LOC126629010 n=1 Tax=Malus sylvestris TaxID=3752 RepID=UPI0021AC8CE5|nr:uncharacterized protein LOC126629010 [Malus sylvestris]